MKNRIWELDAFRGICVLGMVFVHFVYDVLVLYRLADWDMPELFYFVQRWGGVLFVALSGLCATLGSRSVRRGLIVLACGLLVSAVTFGMYKFGFSGKSIMIYFGVLHCLGTCMILWPLFKRLPGWLLAVLGLLIVVIGLYLWDHTLVDHAYLLIFGFTPPEFSSSDYFPLLPNLGYFLLGAVLGRILYRKKESLLPMVKTSNPIVWFLSTCGRHSLLIYILHQPVLSGILYLFTLLR